MDEGKFKEKWVTEKQFLRICKRLGALPVNMSELRHGEFLGHYSVDEGNTFKILLLKKLWISPFTLKYRTTKTKDGKARVGKEMFISNMRLPKNVTF